MNPFQYAGIIVIGLLIFSCLKSMFSGRGNRMWAIGWVLVWVAGGGAIVYPELTTRIARSIGIDRGADLISYCGVLGSLIGFFVIYVKYRKVQSQITALVREIALNKAEIAENHSSNNTHAADTSEDMLRSRSQDFP